MKTVIRGFLFVLILSCTAGATGTPAGPTSPGSSVDGTALWREAVGLYTTESGDYVDTVSSTLDELRYWRQKLLSDRFEEKITRLEVVLSKSNNEVLSSLQDYVNKNGIDGLDDSLMMRLAQLEYDRANFDMTDKMRQYEGELNKYQAGSRKDMPALPAPDYTKTVFYSAELLHKFPNSPLSDRAHYLLGYCLNDEGKVDKAEKIYERLVRLHPYSDLAPEARFRLAESYFDDGRYQDALGHYRILAASKTPFTQKALYKEGATLYASGQYAESAKIFLELFKTEGAHLGGADPEAETLYDESIDYLAHLRAKNVQLTLDDQTDYLVTERLAEAYKRIHDEPSSRKAYLQFVSAHPFSKWSPRFMNNVIDSYTDDNQLAKAQEVRNNFVRALTPASEYWRQFKDDSNIQFEYQDLYEGHVLASAEFYDDQARRTKRPRDYDAAVGFYKKFITEYASSPLRDQASFEQGDLEYSAGRYVDAAKAYLDVMNSDDPSDYLEDAAYGYLLAEIKSVNFPLEEAGTIKTLRTRDGTVAPPTRLTAQETAFMKAARVYTDKISSGSRRQKILYRVAEVFFKHNDFAKARDALELLLKDGEESPIKIGALHLIAATYDLEGNWDGITETNRRLLSYAPSVDTESGSTAGHLQAVELNEAWHIENRGDLKEAAEKYEQFAINYPDNHEAALALYRAGLTYRKSAQIAASNRMFGRILKSYGDSEYAPPAEFFLNANFQSFIDFEKAASGYENFGKKYPSKALSVQAFYNASSLRAGMGQFDRAAADLKQYNQRVADDEVAFQISQYYKKAGDIPDAERVLASYMSGKYGRDLFMRAAFRTALLAEAPTTAASIVRHAEEHCAAIDAASRKYGKTLSARSLMAVAGCAYVKTFAARNEILAPALTFDAALPKYDVLMKKYAAVQGAKESGKDAEWMMRALADAGMVSEEMARKAGEANPSKAHDYLSKAEAFYKKSLELKDQTQTREVPENAIAGLKRLAPENLALNDELSYWSPTTENPDTIEITWNDSLDPLKILFDQKRWDDLKDEADKEISDSPTDPLYMVKARAQAEAGNWKTAKQTLADCAEKMKDDSCVASLLQSGYTGSHLSQYTALLEDKLKTESQAPWEIGAAQAYVRQGKFKEAFSLVTTAISADPQYAPAYAFASRLFIEFNRPQLAVIALEEGIRNTDDDSLEIQKGHLELSLRLVQKAEATIEQFRDVEKPGAKIKILIARSLMLQGKDQEAWTALDPDAVASVGKDDILTAQFYFALKQKDAKRLDALQGAVSRVAENDSTASYLLGIYETVYKHDDAKAKTYLARARENGIWGRMLDLAGAHGANVDREPAAQQSTDPSPKVTP